MISYSLTVTWNCNFMNMPKVTAITEWLMKYVPAFLSISSRHNKVRLSDLVSDLDISILLAVIKSII